ncbi:DUF3144 domain-containing protein [Chitinimonas sp.]|uniref:DUF3144 domain-containing protein n=1 Tax=Chitinimonas sp. TaxID=1934313 RepID=UPI002F92FCAB
MMSDSDKEFFDRADAFLQLANENCTENNLGEVTASLMYASARFNTWVQALGVDSGAELAKGKDKAIAYFLEQYKAMLEENFEDYADGFDEYMKD